MRWQFLPCRADLSCLARSGSACHKFQAVLWEIIRSDVHNFAYGIHHKLGWRACVPVPQVSGTATTLDQASCIGSQSFAAGKPPSRHSAGPVRLLSSPSCRFTRHVSYKQYARRHSDVCSHCRMPAKSCMSATKRAGGRGGSRASAFPSISKPSPSSSRMAVPACC